MTKSLDKKLAAIHADPSGCKEFILADAKDADMAWGVPSPGWIGGVDGRFRTMPEFLEQIRQIVRQNTVDIMLGSVSTMNRLAHHERLFDKSEVTPAIRANDTSDVWCPRGGKYRDHPSLPFATAFLEEAQYGSVVAKTKNAAKVDLGLYSITFNNNPQIDREALLAFKEFRKEAHVKGFRYFLEVFAPNVDAGIRPEQIPFFVNDHICRMLAGVSLADRPLFLKVPYFGPRALEELVMYDPSVIVGILGGSSGTTMDAFQLLADARKYGARVALFGRKIKEAEDPLAFIQLMRRIVEGHISPVEAVKSYHAGLAQKKIRPKRLLSLDLARTGSKTATKSNHENPAQKKRR